MKLFAMADLHLSLSTDKPMDVFGKRWNDHVNKMSRNWMEAVSDEDVVLISGDVSWGLKLEEAKPDLDWVHEMPGRKIITRGNHDLWWSSLSKMNGMYDDILFVQNNSVVIGNTAICGVRGWMFPGAAYEWTEHDEKIYRRELIRLEMALKSAKDSNSERTVLSIHYPPLNIMKTETGFTELIEKYEADIVIYGHLHGDDVYRYAFNGKKDGSEYILTSSDQIGFRPEYICDIDQLSGKSRGNV